MIVGSIQTVRASQQQTTVARPVQAGLTTPPPTSPAPAPIVFPTGPAGESAYQIAIDNGFVGSQAQWLASLIGGGTSIQIAELDVAVTGPSQIVALPATLISIVGVFINGLQQTTANYGLAGLNLTLPSNIVAGDGASISYTHV